MALAARKTEFVNICTFVLIINFACRLCDFPKMDILVEKSLQILEEQHMLISSGLTVHRWRWEKEKEGEKGAGVKQPCINNIFVISKDKSHTVYNIQLRGKLLALKELRVKGETARQKSACPKDSLDAPSTLPFRARWIFPKERKAKVVKDEKMGQVKDEETALLCHWKA